ncbi:MAG: glutaminyl-peptide cyclotransferase [Planctomycetia bacterium]|nr:glutaminyl-peptide cyclotransferase [Planctomycetia bacterium]
MKRLLYPLAMLTLLLFTAAGGMRVPADEEAAPDRTLPDRIKLKLVAKHPHDPKSFCQGLVYFQGPEGRDCLWESSGRYGQSQLRATDLHSGKVLSSLALEDRYFAEGLALWGDLLYQLTWRERVCFTYNRDTFNKTGEFACPFEGWGLATGPDGLYMSDGSSTIRIVSPDDFSVTRTFAVTWRNGDNVILLDKLNELEYIEGELWANVYQTPCIVRIDPKTGVAFDLIDFSALVPKKFRDDTEYVLNGIAYDPAGKRLFLTGKCWPNIYEILISVTDQE